MVAQLSRKVSAVSDNSSSWSSRSWTRPASYNYSIRDLRQLGSRVFSPPPATHSYHARSRSWHLTPSYDVSLEDMLDRKLLPPIGLKDFEQWLTYRNHAVENLYFIIWLRNYTERYRNSSRNRAAPSSLSLSFQRAKSTFFLPHGTYELNLPANLTRPVLNPPPGANPLSLESPEILQDIKEHVEGMLSISLAHFIAESSSNSGLGRRCYTSSGGIGLIAVALIPVLVSILGGYSRWIRLTSFPLFWLGALMALGGYGRVCVIIYFWGDFRQLYPFELDLPPGRPATSISFNTIPMIKKPDQTHIILDVDHDHAQTNSSTSKQNISPSMLESQEYVSIPYDPDIAKPPPGLYPYFTSPTPTSYTHSAQSHMSTDADFDFDFDSLPPSAFSDRGAPSSRSSMALRMIFAPVTRVVNPLIIRAQWEVVKRSSIWAALFAIVATTICTAVPGWK